MSWNSDKTKVLGEEMDVTRPVGEVFEVKIEKIIYGGEGLARHNGQTIFVPFSAPGDRLLVRSVETRRNYQRAVIVEQLEGSPARREPKCAHFGLCGGCQLQHLDYESQLTSKVGFIRESLKRIGHIEWNNPIPIHSAAEWGYRNRAQFKIADGGRRIGFFRTASHQVEDITECPLLQPELNAELAALKLNPPKLKTDSREANEFEVAVAENHRSRWAGPGAEAEPLTWRKDDTQYRYSAEVFFQVNHLMLEKLITAAIGETRGELALDLYSGVGLFSIQLARQFNRVIAIESNEQSCQFASENLKLNQTFNVSLYARTVEDWFRNYAREAKSVDFIVLDPPRAGLEPSVTSAIIQMQPTAISYVSCDPTTLARDLNRFVAADYVIESVTALDLFPQTYHVETCVRLSRAAKS